MTSRIPPCLVNPENYSSYYGGQPACPTLHVFLAESARAIFEKVLHDPAAWITALATLAIAAFTATLWLSTRGMLQATSETIQLAREEFLSTHRPRMRLKHAWFIDQNDWRLGGPLEVNLDFVNIGSSPAHVTWINYQSILLPKGGRLPQRPPYDEIPPSSVRISRFPSPAVINSGVTLARQVCDGILDDKEVHDVLWGERTFYLIGTIEYWDAVYCHLRRTAFCRSLVYQKYPPDSGDMGRFCAVEDPDYEYED